MNTKSDSDDALPSKKNLKLCELIIFVSSNFFREVILSTSFARWMNGCIDYVRIWYDWYF